MHRIMLVDDEESVLKALRRVLAAGLPEPAAGVSIVVEAYTSPAAALRRAEEAAVAVVVSDYRMPGMDGVAFLRKLREHQPGAARLILSGYADLGGLMGAINEARIFRFICKPWNNEEIRLAIAQALEYRNLQEENQRLADEVRAQRGVISRHELELRRLEAESPGITKVKWGPDGSVILFDDREEEWSGGA